MTTDLLRLSGSLCGFSLLKFTLSLSSGFSEFLPDSAEQRLPLRELAQCCDLLRIQLRRNLVGLNSGCSEMIRSDVVQDNAVIPSFHRLCFSPSELFPTYVPDLLSLPPLFLAVREVPDHRFQRVPRLHVAQTLCVVESVRVSERNLSKLTVLDGGP